MESTDAAQALKSTGFEQSSRQDHDEYKYPHSLVRTHISRGPRYTLGPVLLKKMAAQVYLKPSQFEELVSCTLSGQAYKAILMEIGILAKELPQPDNSESKAGKNAKRKRRR